MTVATLPCFRTTIIPVQQWHPRRRHLPPQPPHQLTILNRVASIPPRQRLSGCSACHPRQQRLHQDALLRSSGNRHKGLQYSEPIQVRLAPVLTRADGLANKAVDIVESRYPYPFKTPTGEIYGDIRQHTEHAYDVANKTIDSRVRSPAYGLAQGVDKVSFSLCLHSVAKCTYHMHQRFTPGCRPLRGGREQDSRQDLRHQRHSAQRRR